MPASQLLLRPKPADAEGCVLTVSPESAGWSHVGLRVYRLADDQVLAGRESGREACLVLLSGIADVTVDGVLFAAVGGRNSVFDEAAPGAVYVPADASYRVQARSAVELAVCSAPGRPGREARQISSARMSCETRGLGGNSRYVRNILPESEPADSLLVVEVVTPGGHWSSYPPHKHDSDVQGVESALEETYYHRLNPPQGFALQCVYTDDRSLDETLCVRDGDVVLVPRGYHPVAAAHGYDLYYLNVMAGSKRRWMIRNDPAHEWLLQRR